MAADYRPPADPASDRRRAERSHVDHPLVRRALERVLELIAQRELAKEAADLVREIEREQRARLRDWEATR